MTCECEYGKCTESHGCPVRSTKTPQEEPEAVLSEMLQDMAYGVGLWFLVAAIMTVMAAIMAQVYTGKHLWTLLCNALG